MIVHSLLYTSSLFLSRLKYSDFPTVYPTFVLRPKNTMAYVDDHLWLHCNASGDPKPKISWSKEAQGRDKLDRERFILFPNGTLHIKKVQFADEGRYYCIAANHAEMKQSKFSLKVQGKFPSVVCHSILFSFANLTPQALPSFLCRFFFFGGEEGVGIVKVAGDVNLCSAWSFLKLWFLFYYIQLKAVLIKVTNP